MTRIFRKALIALALTVATVTVTPNFVAPLFAQTSLYATTLGAALSAPAQGSPNTVISLASGTNVAVGQGLTVDGEYMTIQSSTPSATRWNVVRGQSGTSAERHNNGASVLFGATNLFYFNTRQPAGGCLSTSTTATPRVVVSLSVSIYLCPAVSTLTGSTASVWGQITDQGQQVDRASAYTGWTYTTAGALTIQPGVQFVGSSGALAMTLASPDIYMNGLVMVIQASTAQAHTVTYTPGFYGNTTASDVATFGGAIGDNLVIYASNGVWRPRATRNVTFG